MHKLRTRFLSIALGVSVTVENAHSKDIKGVGYIYLHARGFSSDSSLFLRFQLTMQQIKVQEKRHQASIIFLQGKHEHRFRRQATVNHINEQKVPLLILTERSCLASYLIKHVSLSVFSVCLYKGCRALNMLLRKPHPAAAACGPCALSSWGGKHSTGLSLLGVGRLLDHGFSEVLWLWVL